MSRRQVIFGASGLVAAAVLGGLFWNAAEPRVTSAQEAAPVQQAVTRELPQSQAEVQLSFAPVVKQVTPAVVNVYATKTEQGFESPFASDPFFSRFFGGDMFQSRPQTSQSLGSGVIIDKTGVIVTNSHVVSGADDIRIALSGTSVGSKSTPAAEREAVFQRRQKQFEAAGGMKYARDVIGLPTALHRYRR